MYDGRRKNENNFEKNSHHAIKYRMMAILKDLQNIFLRDVLLTRKFLH